MSSHFACIGFPVGDMEAYRALARRAAAQGRRLPAPGGGALVRWEAGSGAEVWAQVDPSGEVVGASPFFSTGIAYRIAVTGTGEDPDEPMEGWIDGWMEPTEDDEPYSGVFPLRVALVDYAVSRQRFTTFPAIHRIEVVGLAYEADLYPDQAAYKAAPGDMYRLPPQSFVSTAHFGADQPEDRSVESTALASGTITSARLLTNPVTDAAFWWIQLATQGITLQVCADRETLGGDARAGEVLAGGFWLLGRVAET